MKAEEEAPAGKLKASTVHTRTTTHTTTDRAFTHGHRLVTAPQHRRWTGRPRRTTVLSDAAVWTFYFLITAASLLATCVLLAIVWPS
ncbi:MAG TPA: hypothetical protein VIK32_02665 [Candidatus Limnocylindrales bacterium]